MRFRRTDRTAGRISAFWEWWVSEGRALAERVIARECDPERLTKEMTSRVGAIGRLAWSFNPGDVSAQALVITSGEEDAHALARRVMLAAPPPDATWSYLDARPPVPDPEEIVISVEGADHVELGEVRVAARLDGTTFDVNLYHPTFPDLAERQRAEIAFLALDAALGEVDTELWIGEVSPVPTPPLDGFGLLALRAVVQDNQRRYVDQDGRASWVVLEGETPTGPLLAAARVPLHPLTAPLLDTYVAVVLPYAERSDDGLPRDQSLERLRELAERLEAELGAAGMVVAHQSVAGVRTLHLYVDSTTGVLPVVREIASRWPEGPVAVHDELDPSWDSVRHFRG